MANKEKAKKNPDMFMTPGTLLRDAREKKALKIKEVAEQLHLKQEYITALEEDDYSSFASLAYVRGYIGNYSKLLEIGDDVLAVFDNLGLKEEKPVNIDSNALLFSSEKLRKRTYLVRWLSLLIFVVLVVVLAVWWQSNNKDNIIPKPLDNEVQQIVTPTNTPTATASQSANTQTATPAPANTTTAPSVSGEVTPVTATPGPTGN